MSDSALLRATLEQAQALGESELRFRQIAENIREVFWMTTPAMDELLYVSPAYETIWRRPAQSLYERPRSFMDLIHPDDRDQAIATIVGRRGQGFEVEYRIVRSDGSVRWIRSRGFPVKDESGQVYRVAGIAEDITERKHAEDQARMSARKIQALAEQREDHLRLVIDTIPTMAWSLLPEGAVDFVNQRWLEYTGLAPDQAIAKAIDIVHPDDLPRIMERWRLDREAGEASAFEARLRGGGGEYRWFIVRTVPLRDERGKIVKWYGTGTDIEDRKRAEGAMRQATTELQGLSRRLVELQESERRDLARELHDRVGQNLTALKFNLETLRPQRNSPGADAINARVDDSAALLASTMETIYNVMCELRPPMLDEIGLAAALDWHGRNFSQRTGIAVTVRGGDPGAARPGPQVEIAFFRIAQEALNNVAKHAKARRAEIEISRANGEFVMSVQDDGIGLADGATKRPRPSLGLVTMRERSQAIGGQFEVQALAGSGTRLTVRVPL